MIPLLMERPFHYQPLPLRYLKHYLDMVHSFLFPASSTPCADKFPSNALPNACLYSIETSIISSLTTLIDIHSSSMLFCRATYLSASTNVNWIVVSKRLKKFRHAQPAGPPWSAPGERALCDRATPMLRHGRIAQPLPTRQTHRIAWPLVPCVVAFT